MKNLVRSESATSKHAERPSLYDGAAGGTHASEAFSILDALDAPTKRSGVARWMLVLVVVALFGTALVLHSAKKSGVSFTNQLESSLSTQLLSKKGNSELLEEPKATGSLASVNFTMPSTTTTDMPQLAPAAALLTSSSASVDKEPSAERAVVSPAKAAQHESHKKANSATSKPVRQKSSSTDRSSAKSSRVPAQHVQGRRNDRDVELIAALLSHVSVAGSNQRESASLLGRKANTLGRDGLSEPLSKKGGAPDLGRDVVLQSAGDTTGTLVKRCLALGFFEGQLCRMRICSGQWGKDVACPVNSPDRPDS